MKKLATILLMMVMVIAGSTTLDAKTKKKGKTGASSGYSFRYKGNIGPYDVRVDLKGYNESRDIGCGGIAMDLKGNYTYTKAGNSLRLEGFVCYGLGFMTLQEYTKSGKNSGTWDLNSDDGFYTVYGTFTNNSNGQVYNVYLKSID